MAAKGNATKRGRRPIWSKSKNTGREQGEDRLSSLPDDILISILSLLPLQLVVTTESLSRRWRGLWTNTTSIDITYRGLNSEIIKNYKSMKYFANLLAGIDKIRMQITSPFIHSFRFSCEVRNSSWLPFFEYWIYHICDRNVRELKLTRRHDLFDTEIITLPRVIFETQSLVSVELVSWYAWKLRDDPDPIELPNLKNLTLSLCSRNFKWAQKQIKTCPSLEKLCIKFLSFDWTLNNSLIDYGYHYIKFSNHNLRSLVIYSGYAIFRKVVINAPKLEYLGITAQILSSFCFDEKPPSMLREAKVETIAGFYHNEDNKESMSKLYGVISNVGSLAIDAYILEDVSSKFSKATRLIIDMKPVDNCHKITTVASMLDLFPVLDVLTLKFKYLNGCNWEWVRPRPIHEGTLRLKRVRMRIEIEINHYNHKKLVEAFSELIDYFLNNTIKLEYFKVTVLIGGSEDEVEKEPLELRQRNEFTFIELLYQIPMIQIGCELEFHGIFFRTPRKAWSPNGELEFHEIC